MESSEQLLARRNRFELKTLLETSRLLIESQEPDFVLNNLLLITMGKLLVPRGAILMFNPNGRGYRVAKIKGSRLPQEKTEIALDIDAKLTEQSIIQGEEHTSLFEKIGIGKGGILFNLKTSNYHLGFLCLSGKGTKQPFTEAEVEFVESLSIISSVAISNSRMFTELRNINRKLDRKVHDLNTLLELSKDFNLMVDREEIARVFKFAMLGQMLIRLFFFALENKNGKSVVSSSGIKEVPSQEELSSLFEKDDVCFVSENEECDFLKKSGIKVVIGLYFQNKKIGVVGVGERPHGAEYTDSEINFLQSLGNLAVLTIQKTHLLEEQIEMQKMEEELSLAKTIQQGLLPNPIPEIPTIDLAARNISSKQVGGDYFDIVETPDGGHLIAIADVTGKGMPAALLMANLQSMLHALAPINITLSEATDSINQIIYSNTPSDKFITFFWGKLHNDRKTFSYVNAGHNPPFLFRSKSSKPEVLEEGGVILGAIPTLTPYKTTQVKMETGDLVVYFTDGITEAMNIELTEEYEDERLVKCINKNRNKSSNEIIDAIIEDINKFSNNIQYDDITLIVMKFN